MNAAQQSRATETAAVLLTSALVKEQAVHRLRPGDDASLIRESVRRQAREHGHRIRTAELDDSVVVVLVSAKIWTDTNAEMRRKLAPPAR